MRITVEMVKAAYQQLGAKPRQKGYGNRQQCCGMGALFYCDNSFHEVACEKIWAWAITNYGQEYVSGFVRGFDSLPLACECDDCKQGYVEGSAAWAAMN